LPWFVYQVFPGMAWDFKKDDPKYENYGNLNYGATGTALGLPPGLLDRAAGAVQIIQGHSRPGWSNPFGAAPYGDDPKDQYYINKGIAYAGGSSS
jgi:hypothetical protein